MDALEVRRESFQNKNIRFLGYNFLKGVLYNNEPVVPVIISEEDNERGKYFNVERLGGESLANFMLRAGSEATEKDKLQVMSHIVGQLEAIDKAGIVLFDRSSRNIQVLSWGSKGVSTRQIDTEDFYDKESDALYTDHREKWRGDDIRQMEDLNVDLWCEEVYTLATVLMDTISDYSNRDIFDKYMALDVIHIKEKINEVGDLGKHPLKNLREDIDKVLAKM